MENNIKIQGFLNENRLKKIEKYILQLHKEVGLSESTLIDVKTSIEKQRRLNNKSN